MNASRTLNQYTFRRIQQNPRRVSLFGNLIEAVKRVINYRGFQVGVGARRVEVAWVGWKEVQRATPGDMTLKTVKTLSTLGAPLVLLRAVRAPTTYNKL